MATNANQRVTNAVLQKDIESLSKRVGEMRDELRADKQATTQRLAVVEKHVVRCATLWDEHKETHQTIDKDIKGVEGDIKKWSLFGGGGGGIAAIVLSLFLDR